MCQHLIPENKEILIYQNFQFMNERGIRSELKMIYDKYASIEKERYTFKAKANFDQDGSQKRQNKGNSGFKKCNSLKNLKNRNTCDEIEKYKLKKQASSPYLRSASTNHLTSKKHKTILVSSSPQKVFRSLLNNRQKDTITRSLSKKNLKNSFKNPFAQKSTPNIHSPQAYTKPLKKKSTNNFTQHQSTSQSSASKNKSRNK